MMLCVCDVPSVLSDVSGVSGARTRFMSIGRRNALYGHRTSDRIGQELEG